MELKSNELRIGNCLWLISKQKYYVIQDGHDIDEGCDSEDLQPIPLTEEILLKCGFEFKGGLGYIMFNGFGIYASLRNGWMVNNSQHIQGIKGIKYLHQLQNLYFALTNTELTVNL